MGLQKYQVIDKHDVLFHYTNKNEFVERFWKKIKEFKYDHDTC